MAVLATLALTRPFDVNQLTYHKVEQAQKIGLQPTYPKKSKDKRKEPPQEMMSIRPFRLPIRPISQGSLTLLLHEVTNT